MEKVYKYSREIIIVTFLLNTLAELAMIMSLYTPVYKKARVLAAQLQLEHAAGAAQIVEQYYKTDSICIAICLALNLVLILVMFVLHENDVISRDRLVKQYEAQLTEKNNEVMRYAKYTSVGRVTTDIIHQWKQPLNRLMLLISNLEDSILSGEEDEVTVLELSGEAKETVRLLSDTITEFRSVLAHDGCNSFFSLEEAVQYVLNIFATRIRENNILCEVRIEADLEIFGKKSILIQAIMNLVDNAVDAIVEREEETTEKNWIGVIEIEGRETADGIILSVWDNAGGIKEKDQKKIFEMYCSGKGDKGSGLGLPIARNTIRKDFHGDLTVQNRGEGVEFLITLPKYGG